MSPPPTVLVLCTGNSPRSLPFHDPHDEPLESFVRVRDEIRIRLVPAVREALGL